MAGAGAGLPRRTRGVCPGPLPTMRPAPGARFENYRPGLRGWHPALRWGPGAGDPWEPDARRLCRPGAGWPLCVELCPPCASAGVLTPSTVARDLTRESGLHRGDQVKVRPSG